MFFLGALLAGVGVFVLSQRVKAATNLLTNPGMETGDATGWTASGASVRSYAQGCPDWPSGSNAQCVRKVPYQVYAGDYALHFSYTMSSSYQIIDLTTTYSTAFLDTAPTITITDHVTGTNYLGGSCGDTYRLRVILRNGSGGAIATYDTNNQTATCDWQTLSHTFSGYGSGVRSIYFERSGQSSEFVQGAYGSAFDGASVYVGDVVAPMLNMLTPADNAIHVATDADLVMRFSEPVNVGTGNVVIRKVSDNSIVETIPITSGQVSGDGTDTITVHPSAHFAESTEYFVRVDDTAIKDLAGNAYAGISNDTTWNFTTGDFTDPTVTVFSPADNARGVAVDTSLAITFDTVVYAQSGNITLFISDGTRVQTFDVTKDISGSGTDTITYTPAEQLQLGASYYVHIDSGAFEDASGNPYGGISDATAWNFSAPDAPQDAQEEMQEKTEKPSADAESVSDKAQKAKIDSWKAYRYAKTSGVSCPERVHVMIRGHDFDKRAVVKIGSKKANETEYDSSQKIKADFCLTELLEKKISLRRNITVTNPNADIEKADEKIRLDVLQKKYSEEELDIRSAAGVANIQRALADRGFLDEENITGYIGPLTIEAIKKFQSANALPDTGIFGSRTRTALTKK